MASRSTPHFKPPLTIIIPYGLKSWLECLCRAILIEGPRQIPEFIAAYCVELLEFRERNPVMDTKDVTHLYQEIREANYVKDWIVCPVPQAAIDCCLAEETLSVSQRTNPRSAQEFNVPSSEPMGGPDRQVQSLSSPPGETHHRTHPGDGPQSSPADLGGQPSPAVEEEAQARPGSAVQSVVFQRAPSLDSLLEANHSQVLISAPTDDVIIVHSANLQETIVFRSDSRTYSGVSPRGSLTRIPSVGEVVKIGVNDTTEVMSDVVVFHQVPSVENLPCTPSALINTSLAAEETVDQVMRSREFLLENVASGSPSIKMVASAAALQQADTEKVSSSEIVGVGAARRVSSVRIPRGEESVGRTVETLKRYTSPQISLLSAHSAEYLKATYKPSTSSLARVSSAPCGEREAAATISPKSSLARVSSVSTGERAAEPACKEVFSNVEETYTLPSTEDLLVSSTASVGRISPEVSAIYSESVLSGSAFSEPEIVGAAHRVSSVRIPSREESVGRTAETAERCTSPRESTQASFVSDSPVMFEEDDWCVITTHSASMKKAVKLGHSENISPITSPSIDLAWEELLQTSASVVDKVALKAFEIVNQKLQCSGMEISELASSNPVVVSQSLNTLSYKDLSHSPSAVEEFSTATARRSEGDITERAPSETAVEGEAISVWEITPAVSARCSASNVSEIVPFETVVLGAAVPLMEELSESRTAFAFVGEASPAVSANDVLERAPSETAVVGAELPERHTTPKVSPQTSFVSAYSDELLNATNLSPQSSLARIPSGYISEGVSPAVSAVCPASDLPERASSETTVMESAPRGIHSAPSMDELLVLPTSVDGFSPAVSARSSRGTLSKRAPSETAVEGVRYSESGLSGSAFSETELVDAAQRVSSVRIPSREESVGRTAETPERHTSPRVSPQTFSESATGLSSKPGPPLSDCPTESGSLEVIFNMEETYTTPSMGEIVPPTPAGDGISASTDERAAESASRELLYMDETYKPPSMADLPGSPAAVGGISPAVSAGCSQSDMAEKAPSETAVGRHTSSRVPPKVPPQTSWSSATGLASKSSLARVPSVSLSDGAKEPAQIDKTLSMEELLASPLYSQWAMSPAGSERVSSVRISSREESVGRTAETPERHTSPGASPRVSPQTSLVSAHVVKSPSGTDISQQSSLPRIPSAPSMDRYTSPRVSQRVSPQSSLARIPSAPSMEELLVSPSASVGRISTAVSRRSLRSSLSERAPSETVIRYSESVLSGRALSKTELVDAAQRVSPVRIPSRQERVGRTPERCTSPRVSPQSSLARIQSAPSIEEPLVSPSAAVGRESPARSGVSLVMSLGISAANVVGPVCFKDVSQIMPTKIPENQGSASSARIPSRQESVGRTAETPERHTSPGVSPRASPRVSPQTSRTLAHVGESPSGTDISQQSSLPRIPYAPSMDRYTFPKVSQRVSSQSSLARLPSAPSMEELLVSPSASVGRILPVVSRKSSRSSLSERAPSETVVGRTAETPERHTSPRVSQQASSAMTDDQVTNPETSERLLTTSTLHSEDFKFACISFHNLAHGITQTEERPASHGTTQTELSALHRTTQTEKRPATHRTTQTELSALHRTTQTDERLALHGTAQTDERLALHGTAQTDERLALHGTTQTEEGPASSRTLSSASPLPDGAAMEHQNPAEELGLGPSPAEDVTEVAEWVKPDNIETRKSSDLVSPQHVENAPITELVSPQHVENAAITELVGPQHVENAPITELVGPQHVENAPITELVSPQHVENAPIPELVSPQHVENAPISRLACPPHEEAVTFENPQESVETEENVETSNVEVTSKPQPEDTTDAPPCPGPETPQMIQEESATQTPEEESVQEELTTKTPEEESIQEELNTKTPEEESVQEELNTKTPEESFPRVPTPQFLLPGHTAEGHQQNQNKPANLIKMAIAERNHLIKRLAKSDPLKNRLDGSMSATGVREVAYATKLMKQRSQTAPQPNIKRMLNLTDKIPNYLLVERSSGTSDVASSQERKPADQESCVVCRGRCTGFLSFSVPIDSFCGAECGCRLQITTDDGDVVYSPAFIQAINPCRPCAHEVAESTDTRPTTSHAHMEWSFKISIKGQSIGDDEVDQEK